MEPSGFSTLSPPRKAAHAEPSSSPRGPGGLRTPRPDAPSRRLQPESHRGPEGSGWPSGQARDGRRVGTRHADGRPSGEREGGDDDRPVLRRAQPGRNGAAGVCRRSGRRARERPAPRHGRSHGLLRRAGGRQAARPEGVCLLPARPRADDRPAARHRLVGRHAPQRPRRGEGERGLQPRHARPRHALHADLREARDRPLQVRRPPLDAGLGRRRPSPVLRGDRARRPLRDHAASRRDVHGRGVAREAPRPDVHRDGQRGRDATPRRDIRLFRLFRLSPPPPLPPPPRPHETRGRRSDETRDVRSRRHAHRRRLGLPAPRRGSARHVDRLRPRRSRLAALLRQADAADGRGNPLRARAPADRGDRRDDGRSPDPRPRLRADRQDHLPAGPRRLRRDPRTGGPRRDDGPLPPSAGRLLRARGARADRLRPHRDDRAPDLALLEPASPTRRRGPRSIPPASRRRPASRSWPPGRATYRSSSAPSSATRAPGSPSPTGPSPSARSSRPGPTGPRAASSPTSPTGRSPGSSSPSSSRRRSRSASSGASPASARSRPSGSSSSPRR